MELISYLNIAKSSAWVSVTVNSHSVFLVIKTSLKLRVGGRIRRYRLLRPFIAFMNSLYVIKLSSSSSCFPFSSSSSRLDYFAFVYNYKSFFFCRFWCLIIPMIKWKLCSAFLSATKLSRTALSRFTLADSLAKTRSTFYNMLKISSEVIQPSSSSSQISKMSLSFLS